jgi:hypothetical protein
MEALSHILKAAPEIALFAALALGQDEETGRMTPVLGFTVTHAISNVLLAVWGPVIVAFT